MPFAVVAAAAVAGVGVEAYNAYQSTKVENTQLGMQQTIFGEQQGFEHQLEQLLADPSSVTKLPGYKFQLDQGSSTVARQMSSSGFYGSGNEAAALTQYGQGFAQNAYMAQAQLLAQLAGLAPSSAQGAGSNAIGASQNAANQTNNTLSQLGALLGMSGYGQGGGVTGVSGADWGGAYADLASGTGTMMSSDLASMALVGG